MRTLRDCERHASACVDRCLGLDGQQQAQRAQTIPKDHKISTRLLDAIGEEVDGNGKETFTVAEIKFSEV